MGSRESEESPTPPHHHHLSSLVVRPSDSGGGGSDYEPGEVRRDPPSYSRSDRFNETSGGHMMHAGSVSPLRHRKVDDHYRSDFENSHHGRGFGSVSPLRLRKVDDHYRSGFESSRGPIQGRGFGDGRGPGRSRDFSPPYGRGRGGGRTSGRDFDTRGFDHGSFRSDGMSRNNPNVAPRDGDWVCPNPLCRNLNFARREYCNKCNKPRFRPGDSPRRNYLGPPRFSGPPMDRSPVRDMNGYRSPNRGWGRDGSRELRAAPTHLRHGGRFPDHHMRRDRSDYPEEDYRERGRFDRPVSPDWGQRDRGRDNFFNGRRGYDSRNGRQPVSPPAPPSPPPQGRWARDGRERSRSPIRGVPPKDFGGHSYMNRGRGARWGVARDRFDHHPY